MPEKLKKGWRTWRFDQMAVMVNDRIDNPSEAGVDRYVGLEHLDSDSLTIRRWGAPSDVEATKLRFLAGDIIFGRRRVYQRKLGVPDFDGICSAHAMVLRARPEVALPEFLPFFMQSDLFMERAKQISVGSLSPTINWKTLAAEEFALPPLEEQRRIAEVLRALVSCVDATRSLQERLHGVECAAMGNAIMERPGVRFVPVADLLLEAPRNGISPTVNSDSRGLRTVSISSVADGVFDPDGCIKYAEIDPESARAFLVRRGDAFVIRGNGNRQLCGKIGMSGQSYDDLFYPDLLIRLRFDPAKILPEFAVTQWNLPATHARLVSRAKSTNGIWKVNGQDIRFHTLGVPEIAEQKRVMACIATLRSIHQETRSRERAIGDFMGRVTDDIWGAP